MGAQRIKARLQNTHIKYLSYFIILAGISIRLYHFFLNRSLWLDEAMLSNNIIQRSFTELLVPLSDKQIAPIGFIVLQKISISMFGVSEYSLRIFPTLAGIVSIIIFYFLLRDILGEKAAAAGLLIFITGKMLIFHSTEAKQYGMDVFAFILSFYYLYFKETDLSDAKMIIMKGLLGSLLIWLSHCAILFLASITFASGIEFLSTKRQKDLKTNAIVWFTWLVSFGINYFLFLQKHPSQAIQEASFVAEGYLPVRGTVLESIHWFYPGVIKSVVYPIGVNMSPIYLCILIFAGIIFFLKRRVYRVFAILLPLLIHVILSAIYLYPFGGRFNLYLITPFIILMIAGLILISDVIPKAGIAIACLIFLGLAVYPLKRFYKPFEFEEMKPALDYINNHSTQNDVVYIHPASLPAFDFYQNNYSSEWKNIVRGTSGFENIIDTLNSKKRFWVLMTHFDPYEKELLISTYNKKLRVIDEFEEGGACLLLLVPNQP